MPSTATISQLLKKLRENGILQTIKTGAGRRPEILALVELLKICEDTKELENLEAY